MEKLEKLIKEFRIETNGDKNLKNVVYSDGIFQFRYQPYVGAELENTRCLDEVYVISKSFGFIKWLVDNDKLKWNNKLREWDLLLGMPEKQDYYVMMLSVCPNPIEFLISILKIGTTQK